MHNTITHVKALELWFKGETIESRSDKAGDCTWADIVPHSEWEYASLPTAISDYRRLYRVKPKLKTIYINVTHTGHPFAHDSKEQALDFAKRTKFNTVAYEVEVPY